MMETAVERAESLASEDIVSNCGIFFLSFETDSPLLSRLVGGGTFRLTATFTSRVKAILVP